MPVVGRGRSHRELSEAGHETRVNQKGTPARPSGHTAVACFA
jgi:hypothetical protein